MSTTNESEARVPGIYELARHHLTVLCDQFLYADPVRIVSAWECCKAVDPEDLTDPYEGPISLRLEVMHDIGRARTEEGCGDADCFASFAPLLAAYGKGRWPYEAMRDYLRVFEGYDEQKAEATATRMWENARVLYDRLKFADGKPAKKAA